MNTFSFHSRSSHSRRRGQTLIGLLVVGIIMIALLAFYLGRKADGPGVPGGQRTTALGQSVDRGENVALQNNLSQIRMFIGMYRGDNDGKAPADLTELKRAAKFPPEMWINPLDNKPLVYDPVKGDIYPAGQAPPSALQSDPQGAAAPAAPAAPAQSGVPNVNIPQPQAPAEDAE